MSDERTENKRGEHLRGRRKKKHTHTHKDYKRRREVRDLISHTTREKESVELLSTSTVADACMHLKANTLNR